MKLSDYELGMRSMMNDRDYLYGSLIREMTLRRPAAFEPTAQDERCISK